MNIFLTILFIIITIIILLIIFYIYLYNKVNDTVIVINEAEIRIDKYLKDKFNLLSSCLNLTKDDVEKVLELSKDFNKLKVKKYENSDLDRVLEDTYNQYLTIYEEDDKLKKNEEVKEIMQKIEINNEELITLRNYYNLHVSYYNKLIKKIPTIIVAKIKKYKARPFYNLTDIEDLEDEEIKL